MRTVEFVVPDSAFARKVSTSDPKAPPPGLFRKSYEMARDELTRKIISVKSDYSPNSFLLDSGEIDKFIVILKWAKAQIEEYPNFVDDSAFIVEGRFEEHLYQSEG